MQLTLFLGLQFDKRHVMLTESCKFLSSCCTEIMYVEYLNVHNYAIWVP